MNSKEIFEKHLAPTSTLALGLEIDSADGTIVTDVNGKDYLDLIAGIGVVSLGHQHPAIKKAVFNQMNKHAHVMVYGEFIQPSINNLALKLSKLLPEQLSTSYFVNSGTEANEGAIKLAKRITGRYEIIAFKGGYHGNTQGSMSVSSNEINKQAFRPLIPGVKFIELNKIDDLECITTKTAAVIIEPVQGDAGVIIPDSRFLRALRIKCDESGAQLIFDEIQTGIGRTGKMFAFEHFDIIPDIIALAKGLGGGLPIGAFVSSKSKMSLLAENPMLGHITTFGGNPVSCAAAGAVLETIDNPEFLNQIEEKGALFSTLLKHPKVKQIRRIGLMIAVELENEDSINKAVELALRKGVIIFWFLSTRNAFRISPPLTISFEEVKKSCNILQEVFDQL